MNREYRLHHDRGSVNPWGHVRRFDSNMNIFRYMDFEKFVRLMITKSLYFPRLDELEDEFEGSPRIKIRESGFREGALLRSSLRRLSKFVSCWTCLEGYPNYMWKEYAPGNGVAIKTTTGKLLDNLEIKPDTIGEVMYRNEDSNITPILDATENFALSYFPGLTDPHRIIAFNEYLNRVQPYQDLESGYLPRYDGDDIIGFEMGIRMVWPYMIKRTFYEDESEFRLVFNFGNNGLCNELSLEERYDLLSRTPYGFKVRLHTLDFIDEIKISPYADEDIELILKKISDKNMESKFDNNHENLSEYRYKHNDIHKMLYDRATLQQDPPDIPNIPHNEFESNVYVDNSGYLCNKSTQ